jgi:hypothetical protein
VRILKRGVERRSPSYGVYKEEHAKQKILAIQRKRAPMKYTGKIRLGVIQRNQADALAHILKKHDLAKYAMGTSMESVRTYSGSRWAHHFGPSLPARALLVPLQSIFACEDRTTPLTPERGRFQVP